MKHKIFMTIASAALLSAVLVLTVGAAARQHKGGPGFGGPPSPERMLSRMAEDLDLSDEQISQVKAIMTEQETRTETYRATLADLDQQMRNATANGQFDEAKVREIATQQAQAMTELIVERERGRSKTFAVLSADQRTKLEQMHERGGPPPPPAGKFGFGPDR